MSRSSSKEVGDEDFPLTLSPHHHFVPFENLQERLELAHKDKEVRAQLRNGFTNPPAELFLVRGPNYLKEGHGGKNLTHLKVPSAEPLYDLIGVNMFRTGRRITKTAEEIGQLRRFFESQPIDKPDAEFPRFLIVNWMISPLFGWGKNHIVQHIFRLSEHPGHDSSIKAAFSRFKAGTDQERNHQLKYMFRVVEAPSAVKTAISYLGGERPVLIGKALTTHYHFGPNYLEINSDVSSSKIASAINGTILKNVETLVMDCSWLLEGQREEELPERLLCRIRWIWNCVEDVVVALDDSGEPCSPK